MTVQCLEKYSSTVQQAAGIQALALSEQQEKLLIGGGGGGGRSRAEGPSATGGGGQAAFSLSPDIDGTGSGSLLDSILFTLLKKQSSDVWVVALFFSS